MGTISFLAADTAWKSIRTPESELDDLASLNTGGELMLVL
jgi:hypothetical protein